MRNSINKRVVNRRLAQVGLGERTEQLSLALQLMLDSYDKLAVVIPEGSSARPLLDGAFNPKHVQLAREIL